MEVKLSEVIGQSFYPVHRTIRSELVDEFWLKGGRGSLKSSFVSIQIVLGIISDADANAVCFRKVSNTIRDSVQNSILWAIDILGETDNFHSITSPTEITYKPTGQKIFLRGLDEPRKIKSIKARRGYLKYLWFEEADEYQGADEIRSVEQSVLRGGQKFVEFFCYNPPRNPRHWINVMAEENKDNKFIHHSSYLEVPRHWLGEKFFEKAERLKKNNYELYLHEYEGRPIGNPEEIIFSGKWEVRNFETPPVGQMEQERFFFGADWGFAQDPTVLIRCFIKDDCLWVDHEVYKIKTEIDHMVQTIFDKIPESRKWMIEADSSGPEKISYIKRQGFMIRGAKKWEGSVTEGIQFMLSFKKIILHERCKRLAKEFETYSYKIDKNTREILPVVDDKKDRIREEGDQIGTKDDGMDAIRYALSTYIKPKKKIYAFTV